VDEMTQDIKGLDGWIKFFETAEIPILKRTIRELAVLQADPENLSVRAVTDVISHDPLMTVILLRYLQQHKHNTQLNEVVQIEQALMMLGMQTFFEKVEPQLAVEEILDGRTFELTNLLQAVRRAIQAAHYAKEWAVRLQDLHFDEIRIAALLHNFAEILMWCYASEEMAQVRHLQQNDKALRTRDAQKQIFGFKLSDLQLALARSWGLPELLIGFMNRDDGHGRQMRNLVLAVNLARHVSNGWDDAALPDDYKQIGELLGLPAEQVRQLIHVQPS
jgi:Predicted signal transduction protein